MINPRRAFSIPSVFFFDATRPYIVYICKIMLHCKQGIGFLPILHTEMKRKTQLELSTFCLVSYMSSKIAQSPVEIARIQMLNKIQERKKWRNFI